MRYSYFRESVIMPIPTYVMEDLEANLSGDFKAVINFCTDCYKEIMHQLNSLEDSFYLMGSLSIAGIDF